MKTIYLDHAAATPVDEKVLEAMRPYFSEKFYNPSALYLPAKVVSGDIAEARSGVARVLGARPGEIFFTAGGTEADNLAIHGVMGKFPESNLVVSPIEHDAVLEPASAYDVRVAPVQPDGLVDLKKLEELIDDDTVMVSVMYANNEIGTIQPIKQVAEMISKLQKRRNNSGNKLPIYFHTDACQAANYLDLHVSRLGADMMTLNGGKIYGPKQSGVLYVRAGTELKPQILGGGQERGMRSGTENVPAIVGFARALEMSQSGRHKEAERLQRLQAIFIELIEEKLPRAVINGSRKHRLPNNVHVTIPGQDNERLIMALDEAGILAAAGSACSAGNDEPSHVLKAIGLTDVEARASLRFTMGRHTSERDIRKTVETLAGLVA
jgi:cysteine desulfurase